jgi:hypothetical protein
MVTENCLARRTREYRKGKISGREYRNIFVQLYVGFVSFK